MTLKAGHAGPASHIYREVMNPKAKSEESPNLASIERESKQLKTLGLSRPSKPSNIGTQLGVPRSQTRGKRDLILWEHVDAPNKCAEGIDINRVWLSTVHKVGVPYASEGCHKGASPRRGASCHPIVTGVPMKVSVEMVFWEPSKGIPEVHRTLQP
jgi:hypothetical protein